MIVWLTGNSGAGKTTLARELKTDNTVILDGDEMRDALNTWDLSEMGRWQHNLRIARLAKVLELQGFDVVVSVIAPYEKLRQEVQKISGCRFVYLPFDGDDQISNKPYERPTDCATLPRGDVQSMADTLLIASMAWRK